MKTKHTPGPWKATKDPHSIRGEDYCIGMETDVAQIDRVAVCSECDASLISAAPDLLDALQLVVDTAENGGWPSAVLVIAKAAIAKAVGHNTQ